MVSSSLKFDEAEPRFWLPFDGGRGSSCGEFYWSSGSMIFLGIVQFGITDTFLLV